MLFESSLSLLPHLLHSNFNDRIILDNYIWPDDLIKVSFYIYLTLITQLAKKGIVYILLYTYVEFIIVILKIGW
jgi:hypothetical protein